MEKIIQITNMLLALKMYFHETHLRFEDYGIHQLTTNLGNSIDEDIDRLKELIENDLPQIADGLLSASSAAAYLKALPMANDDITRLENCLKLEKDLMALLNKAAKEADCIGLQNAFGDICEHRRHDCYFIKNILKAADNV